MDVVRCYRCGYRGRAAVRWSHWREWTCPRGLGGCGEAHADEYDPDREVAP